MAKNGAGNARVLSQEFSTITQDGSKVSNKLIYGITHRGLRAKRSLISLLSSPHGSPTKSLSRSRSRVSQPDVPKTPSSDPTIPHSASFSGTPSKFRNWSITVRESSAKRLARLSRANLRKVRSLDWMREFDGRSREVSPPPPPSPEDPSTPLAQPTSPTIQAEVGPTLTLDLPALDLDVDIGAKLAYESGVTHSSPVAVPNAPASPMEPNQRGWRVFAGNPFIVGSVQKDPSPFDTLQAAEVRGGVSQTRTEQADLASPSLMNNSTARALCTPMAGSNLSVDQNNVAGESLSMLDAVVAAGRNRTPPSRHRLETARIQGHGPRGGIRSPGQQGDLSMSHSTAPENPYGRRELPLAHRPHSGHNDGSNAHRRRKSSLQMASATQSSAKRHSVASRSDLRDEYARDARYSHPRTPKTPKHMQALSSDDTDDANLVPDYIHTFRDMQGMSGPSDIGRTPPFPRICPSTEEPASRQPSAEMRDITKHHVDENCPGRRVNSVSTHSMMEFVQMSDTWLSSRQAESTEDLHAATKACPEQHSLKTAETSVTVTEVTQIMIEEQTKVIASVSPEAPDSRHEDKEDSQSECSTIIHEPTRNAASNSPTPDIPSVDGSDSDSVYSDTDEVLSGLSNNTYMDQANNDTQSIDLAAQRAQAAKCDRLIQQIEASLAGYACTHGVDISVSSTGRIDSSGDATLTACHRETLEVSRTSEVVVGLRGGMSEKEEKEGESSETGVEVDKARTATARLQRSIEMGDKSISDDSSTDSDDIQRSGDPSSSSEPEQKGDNAAGPSTDVTPPSSESPPPYEEESPEPPPPPPPPPTTVTSPEQDGGIPLPPVDDAIRRIQKGERK